MDYWDTVAQAWQGADRQRLWRKHSDAVNSALCSRWLPSQEMGCLLKTDLFDEMCSEGLYPVLASRAQSVVGTDRSFLAVQGARSRYSGLRATAADVRRLPFASDTFDAIVSNSTLDHFESIHDIVVSLDELHRVLRPGGHLLLTLDNLGNPMIALRNSLPISLLNRLSVVHFYVGATCGPRRLRRMLVRTGFEVLEMDAIMHHPSVLAVAMASLLQRRAGPNTQQRYLRALMALERLSSWPTRYLSAHFVAAHALKS